LEAIFLLMGGIAGLCGLAGVVWTMVVAIQNGDIAWGIIGLCCGIVAIVYAVQHIDECKVPLILMVVGVVGRILIQVLAMST
jgi:hypothetical protein